MGVFHGRHGRKMRNYDPRFLRFFGGYFFEYFFKKRWQFAYHANIYEIATFANWYTVQEKLANCPIKMLRYKYSL